MRRVTTRLALAGMLIVGGLAACAQPASEGAVSATSGPSGTTGPATPPPTHPTPPSASPGFTATPLPPAGGARTIHGSVQEGVEAGCTLLKADDGVLYLLLGGDRAAIAKGGRLEIDGHVAIGLMTTCQQGTPFMVKAVRAG